MLHRYYTEVAKDYGVTAAALFYHISYWVQRNKMENHNLHVGEYWVYESVQKLSETTYSYMTPYKIGYAIQKLIKGNLIKTGDFNKMRYDRTRWYTLTDKGWSILRKCQMECGDYPDQYL
ncbi:MAG: hypothetical protein PHC41_04745 [Lachnospiraceae bacterium]|nr:hypothetical protein [Lachnospiraceae bacterium]MDD3615516.1 hypothetical protein [Lachnospiraceae bacterium]